MKQSEVSLWPVLLAGLFCLAGCALSTVIQRTGHEEGLKGASLFVVNTSTASIENMGVIKTFWLRWDPDIETAIAQKEIREALMKRNRFAKTPEEAEAILKIDYPRPENTGVPEELELIRRSNGELVARVRKNADPWDLVVQSILDWLDGKHPDRRDYY